jgi:hypothetical protein
VIPPVYVVVCVAPNGHVSAWGDDDGLPFADRASATRLARHLGAVDRVHNGDDPPVRYFTCAVVGGKASTGRRTATQRERI